MEAKAITRYVRISAFKARQVTRLIQGKPAQEALQTVELMPRKAARIVAKTLKSAIANAENRGGTAEPVDASRLVVREAVAGEAPTLRRFRPKARGMAGRVRKRSSHIRIVVSDEAKPN
jgi:large subunit ribosomal protein L22